MIHAYSFRNYLSFKDTTEVSFRVTKHVPETSTSCVSGTGQRLNKVMAVVGPNGGGKTTLLKPLSFLGWFVASSFQNNPKALISVEPHFFGGDQKSEFQVEFDLDGKLWRYALVASAERVLSESLHVKTTHLFSYVFTRKWLGEGRGYKIKQQGFGLNQSEAEKVRENASLISTAVQYQVPLAIQVADALAAFGNVGEYGRKHFEKKDVLTAAQYFFDDAAASSKMSELLQSWDLGLSDVRVKMFETHNEKGELQQTLIPYGVHRNTSHEVELSLFYESSGTQSAFVLLAYLLSVLAVGCVAVIDEFEADLHPHMLEPILDLFFSPETNPHNAQIIFTCHSPEILNVLHKSQVMLVQKDEACESHAWRLDEIKGVRSDDNLYAKYMAGAYGAVPNL